MIPIIKLRDADGNIIPVPAIQGEKGAPGDTSSVNGVAPDTAGNIALDGTKIPYSSISSTPTVSSALGSLSTTVGGLQTSKQDTITAAGILKGDGAGGVTAAEAGTDYATRAQVTAKQDMIQVQGILKGLGTGTISMAVAGVDYMAVDAIVYGATANGNYVKLPDGTLIMWRFGEVTLGDTSTAYLPLPVSVAEDGAVAVASATSYYNSMTSVGCHVASDHEQIAIYFSSGGTAITGRSMRYNYIVIGRWK